MIKLILMVTLRLWFYQSLTLEDAVVSFEISHMGVLTVEGQFNKVKGELTRTSLSEWSISGSLEVSSIDTKNTTRDKTILTEQYLDAENYPEIPFVAKLKKSDEKILIVIDLSIRGIEFQLSGLLIEKNEKLISEAITFKRSEIGLDFGLMDSLIGDEITLEIDSGIGSGELDRS